MNTERSRLIEFLRGELVGPIRSAGAEPPRARYEVMGFGQVEPHPAPDDYNAWLFWRPEGANGDEEEILSIQGGRSPHRSYGIGVLYPEARGNDAAAQVELAMVKEEEDTIDDKEPSPEDDNGPGDDEARLDNDEDVPSAHENAQQSIVQDDDFEISSGDARRPSSMAISFCVRLQEAGHVVVSFPRSQRLPWQDDDQFPFPLNGVYEPFQLRLPRREGQDTDPTFPAYRRRAAMARDAEVRFATQDLAPESSKDRRRREVPKGPGIREKLKLEVQAYRRPHPFEQDAMLLTVVMRNRSDSDDRDLALFQSCFNVRIEGGTLLPYPQSPRPSEAMDEDEQSMELLYRDARCWAIGHGCAAGWQDSADNPELLVADVMPTVELPSMTPDIEVDGEPLRISMSELASLPSAGDQNSGAWPALDALVQGYADWIECRERDISDLPERLKPTATRHIDVCRRAQERMRYGLKLLRTDKQSLQAFRWANEAMLLQQISTKQIERRTIRWDSDTKRAVPQGEYMDPFLIREAGTVRNTLGHWRAFQIAFLLMSLRGMAEPGSDDRELVDLVWFPTGGGKTEAYLGVAAFQMFHQRLLMAEDKQRDPGRDGTNVLMRYTLRMLTTDQFQRAAGLICGMEVMRKDYGIAGAPFRLGLWLGSGGTPNTLESAKTAIGWFKRDKKADAGNPLVLTECPWCRTEIGRIPVGKDRFQLAGIIRDNATLYCPDSKCHFHDEYAALPVEVVDERIYQQKPSLVIGTADKFAMLAYKPEAGALFGRGARREGGAWQIIQSHRPPSLIVQDELHLISGPLGTLFGLYETVISDLCTFKKGNRWQPPKIIASTATVRGAGRQVSALFARERTALFPPPGIDISDSFFGRYARYDDGTAAPGRLYVGIHALYGSFQTTQARTYAALLARSTTFDDSKKDPWWTLLAYHNSMRELAGARTLFDSDIQSRLKHLADRERTERRYLNIVELSSRLSQAQIVSLKNRLSTEVLNGKEQDRVDACLSSNIIEVGVDIDRLSLMAVVGQPKSTASYIQATGRVGRRWQERPGLVLALLNPFKSRDTSHFEQFHIYHRRLYERVEPTSATPFSLTAIQRGLVGAMIACIRQQVANGNTGPDFDTYKPALGEALELFRERCERVGMDGDDLQRSLDELESQFERFTRDWAFFKPQYWFDWSQPKEKSLLMLVPGKYATGQQKDQSSPVPTSLREVDAQAELAIDYFQQDRGQS